MVWMGVMGVMGSSSASDEAQLNVLVAGLAVTQAERFEAHDDDERAGVGSEGVNGVGGGEGYAAKRRPER